MFPRLPDNSIDTLISDPPYGTTALSWDKSVCWPAFWEAAARICKENAVVVLFAAQPFATDLINSNRHHFRYELIWHKTVAVGWLDAKRRPLRAHENVLVFARHPRQSIYRPQMELGHKPYARAAKAGTEQVGHYGRVVTSPSFSVDGGRYPRSVLTVPSRSGPALHPTQKPLPLLEWLVNTYSRPGDTVLDPFMGSGTTGVACARAVRRFVGIERERGYFETAKRRMRESEDAPH